MELHGFKPIYNKDSEILILGSFPSVVSRNQNFYYGNKQNRFWKMINKNFNVNLESINQKTEFLLEHNIALWDIISSCQVEGSMDRDIKNAKFVNLKSVLSPNTKIKKILCNGKLSYNLTTQYCKQNNIELPIIYMPSTSPANVRFKEEDWISQLKK